MTRCAAFSMTARPGNSYCFTESLVTVHKTLLCSPSIYSSKSVPPSIETSSQSPPERLWILVDETAA